MEKVKLTRFIDKYHLNGNVNSVVLNSKDDYLATRFMTIDKSLLGELKMNSWKFDEAELGVYDTDQLFKLLGVLSTDVKLKLNKVSDKAVSLNVADDYSDVNFMLSDLSVINTPPPMKRIPDFDVKIKVDTRFIMTFISGQSALSENTKFTVLTDNNGVKLVLGYSSINSNRVTIPVETESYEDIEPVSFDATLFKDVLMANKECESATLEISQEGLARINFKVDEYDATYYLVAVQDVD